VSRDSAVYSCSQAVFPMPHDMRLLFKNVDSQFSTNPRLTLRDLAHNLGVDRHAIEKAMRQTQGLSFREYKKQKQLKPALALLSKRSDLEVKEIAYYLGFSPNAFSRFIKVRTGKSPREIRRTSCLISLPRLRKRKTC